MGSTGEAGELKVPKRSSSRTGVGSSVGRVEMGTPKMSDSERGVPTPPPDGDGEAECVGTIIVVGVMPRAAHRLLQERSGRVSDEAAPGVRSR